MRPKKIQTEDYFIGNLGSPEATEEILSACPILEENVQEATTNHRDFPDHYHRQCYVSMISVEESNFIETGLKHILRNVNNMIWKMPLDNEWDCGIQYTRYSGVGHHYGWHIDNFQGNCSDRRLSIVYSLSKKTSYQGGEFDIRRKSNNKVYTIKFDYGDFIVFPSDTFHRVRPLKGGTRTTMVGWYR